VTLCGQKESATGFLCKREGEDMRTTVTVSKAVLDWFGPRPGAPVLFPGGFEVLSRVLGEVRDRQTMTVSVDVAEAEKAGLDFCEWSVSRTHRDKHLRVQRGPKWSVVFKLRCWRWSWQSWRFWRHVRFVPVED